MKKWIKKIALSIYGLLQGAVGSYLALLGFFCAFPQTPPGSKDYEEDMLFVPFGYIIMLILLITMVATFIVLRKNKTNLLLFLVSWLVGLSVYHILIQKI